MINKLLVSLFLLGILVSCDKDKNSPEKKKLLSIEGITARDVNGNLVGTEDFTDWKADSEIPVEVQALLNFADTLNAAGCDTSTVSLLAYPNPVDKIASMNIHSSNTTLFKFIIVDDSLNLLNKSSLILNSGANSLALSFDSLTYNSNRIYRMYYAFSDGSKKIYLAGHGDLQKK